MKKSDIAYIVCSVFAAATAFFYCCTRWFPIRLPRYYPLEHTWKWIKEQGVPSQRWYAMQVFAYLAAGVVALVVYLVLRSNIFKEAQLKPLQTKLFGIIVTLVIIVCMSYILYYEFGKWRIF
ncbi:MAG: hypothetical protein ACYTE5_03135 [Planctomycetota bacterium]|jgi:ABC-type Fe3+-siderophore transport system permease subunit